MYPVLPLRDIVVFPTKIVPLFVGREKSVRALEEVMREDKHILVVTQKNAQDDDPSPDQIYEHGTIASVLQLLKLPEGTVKVLVEGSRRAKIERYVPAMPLSRESRQYLRLQRTLGAYRSVMGQPRQEDLIKLMGEDVDWPRIDLRPPR